MMRALVFLALFAAACAERPWTADLEGRLPPTYRITPAGVYDADPSDGLPSPIVRYPPAYPRYAAQRGIQATCSMTLDITDMGTTENICGVCTFSPTAADVQEAALREQFVQAAANAVQKWRYSLGEPLQDFSAVVNFVMDSVPASPPPAPAPIACRRDPIS